MFALLIVALALAQGDRTFTTPEGRNVVLKVDQQTVKLVTPDATHSFPGHVVRFTAVQGESVLFDLVGKAGHLWVTVGFSSRDGWILVVQPHPPSDHPPPKQPPDRDPFGPREEANRSARARPPPGSSFL